MPSNVADIRRRLKVNIDRNKQDKENTPNKSFQPVKGPLLEVPSPDSWGEMSQYSTALA